MAYELWRMILKAMMAYGVVSAWMWEVDIVFLVDFTAKRLGGR